MGLHTQTVKGISRASYRSQVQIELLRRSLDMELSPEEEAKVARVARFLDAYQCVNEIEAAREKEKKTHEHH